MPRPKSTVQWSGLTKAAACLVAIVVVVLVLPFMIVGSPIASLRRRLRLRRFYHKYDNRLILVWHSRRGWHDLCFNNLLPALPPATAIFHDLSLAEMSAERSAMREAEEDTFTLGAGRSYGIPRPYLLYVAGRTLQMVSLNSTLQPFKRRSKRDPATQAEIAELVKDLVATSFARHAGGQMTDMARGAV